jgi:putative spermidine/putrescine transport system ATP-binding protein
VQIGTPREIYEEPNSEFVAGFVGISNLIHRDGKTISIRPEKIKLGNHFDQQVSGQVSTVMFLGADTRIDVLVGADNISLLVGNDGLQGLPKVGDTVQISWDSKYESQVG